MFASTNQEIQSPADFDSCKRKAVLLVTSLCALFVIVTALYCYVYALYVNGDSQQSLWRTFSCVSIDWLAWAFIAPILAHFAVKEDVTTRAGVIAIIKLLIMGALGLGAARVLTEYWLKGDSLVSTLLYFLPRYLYVTASFIGVGVFYVFRFAAEQEIQHLKERQLLTGDQPDSTHSQTKPPKPLVVMKGNCRVLIQPCDIISISASGNYLEINTAEGEYLMRNTMKAIEAHLDSDRFVRIHRSHLVSLAQVESVSPTRLEANLSNGKVLKIGKKYTHALPHFRASASFPLINSRTG